ncbi:hypothetical protein, partial [Mesorhizobium sp. M2A.F.Ca.ET.037.01.1.1]|uniref:hypothetical protein n=1 Tax=Mesorhizobium sp. M2A.F.Ca.ET.037.01.1.1 TaxID=2496748 RepID=UPI001AEC874E
TATMAIIIFRIEMLLTFVLTFRQCQPPFSMKKGLCLPFLLLFKIVFFGARAVRRDKHAGNLQRRDQRAVGPHVLGDLIVIIFQGRIDGKALADDVRGLALQVAEGEGPFGRTGLLGLEDADWHLELATIGHCARATDDEEQCGDVFHGSKPLAANNDSRRAKVPGPGSKRSVEGNQTTRNKSCSLWTFTQSRRAALVDMPAAACRDQNNCQTAVRATAARSATAPSRSERRDDRGAG